MLASNTAFLPQPSLSGGPSTSTSCSSACSIPHAGSHTRGAGEGGIFNFPAIVLVTLCSLLLLRGARESATVNAVMVIIKLAVLIFFVIIAFTAFSGENFTPFAPWDSPASGRPPSIFFTFIGLDAVSTAGEEVHNPRRTLPLAIILATIIVTTVYILVAVAGIGVQQYQEFEGQEAGLAVILRDITGSAWPAAVLSAGAVISIFSATLGDALRTDAHPLRHGARRDAPRDLPQDQPDLPRPSFATL